MSLSLVYGYLQVLRTFYPSNWLGGLLLAWVLLWSQPALPAGEPVIVAHADVLQTSITLNQARGLFGMRSPQWPDGRAVKVYVLPDRHPLHDVFCKTILNIFPHQLRTAWDRQVYSGTGQAPIEVANEDEMLARIAATPGAVGYVSKERADTTRMRKLELRSDRHE